MCQRCHLVRSEEKWEWQIIFPVVWDYLVDQFLVDCSVLTLNMLTLLDGGLLGTLKDVRMYALECYNAYD